MRDRNIWDDINGEYDGYGNSSGYDGDDEYDRGYGSSFGHDDYGDPYDSYKSDTNSSYSTYGEDSYSDSFGEKNHRTSGWKRFEDMPADTDRLRSKSGYNLQDVPKFVWFIIAGVIIAAIIVIAVINDGGATVNKLNDGIENVAAAIIEYLVYVGIVWSVYYFTFGRRMRWRTRSMCLGIICALVLLCYVVPSLGILLITLCILMVLLYKIIRP